MPERAARIIGMIPDKQAAAIMNATAGAGDDGVKKAAEWTDIIRRMKQEEKAAKKGT